jgi:hypothetical protein
MFVRKHGSISNGAPGERPRYTKGYYAAFVVDPLGNNVEVMCWDSLKMKFLMNIPLVLTGSLAAIVAFGAAKYFN